MPQGGMPYYPPQGSVPYNTVPPGNMASGNMASGPGGAAPPTGGQYVPFNFWNMPLSTRRTFIDFASNDNASLLRILLTPEGLNLHFTVASLANRFFALILDYFLIFILNFVIFILPTFIFGRVDSFVWTVTLFFTFVVNNVYFIFFELRWQGRTPGKLTNKLCVINRQGGELSPFAVVSRNITRQIEIVFPLAMFIGFFGQSSIWNTVLPIFWLILVTCMPLWNRDHLRAGDLLGGTIVIAMPAEELLPDLSGANEDISEMHYNFTKEQLSIYGYYELHILEEILRMAEKGVTLESISKVANRISQRIASPLPERMDYDKYKLFLTDFYSAERAFLEEAKLYGRSKANQYAPMVSHQEPPSK
jgi:uncharacterized RDD family membrane protein YckC